MLQLTILCHTPALGQLDRWGRACNPTLWSEQQQQGWVGRVPPSQGRGQIPAQKPCSYKQRAQPGQWHHTHHHRPLGTDGKACWGWGQEDSIAECRPVGHSHPLLPPILCLMSLRQGASPGEDTGGLTPPPKDTATCGLPVWSWSSCCPLAAFPGRWCPLSMLWLRGDFKGTRALNAS